MNHGDVMISQNGKIVRPKDCPQIYINLEKELVKQDVFLIQLQVYKMVLT